MKITFLGAAKTVTGSKYLITTENEKVLVDCGLFQGFKDLRMRNWQPYPILPIKIFAPDSRNTILPAGYQAAGARGEALRNSKKALKFMTK